MNHELVFDFFVNLFANSGVLQRNRASKNFLPSDFYNNQVCLSFSFIADIPFSVSHFEVISFKPLNLAAIIFQFLIVHCDYKQV